MHLGLTARQKALTAAVREFTGEWLPGPVDEGNYFTALRDRGWSAPGWPAPWGGGLDAAETLLVESTLAQAGAPLLDPGTLHYAGPLLMALADETLCERYLPGMAAGGIRWALHGSILGGAPLSGRLQGDEIEFDSTETLVYGARGATAILLLATADAETALTVAELAEAAVRTNQPLDPDTIYLEALKFEVLATTRTHRTLASVLALQGGSVPAFGRHGLSCWAPRLRDQFERLLAEDPDTAAHPECASLAVALSGLEAMEQRAAFTADDRLREAVAIRSVELGRAMAYAGIERLGYYALPAPDRARQHNELPAQGLAAQDAIAELIRYLEGDFGIGRDRLAQNLGIASTPDAPV